MTTSPIANGSANGHASAEFEGEIVLKGRVLLAEDGLDNQQIISLYLRLAGADVTIAPNGRIAVELATLQPFDLILMDMEMPELDGYAATAELRRRGCRAPIIALTAHTAVEDQEKCLAAGCSDYITKPIEKNTLLLYVSDHLAGRAARHAAPLKGPLTEAPALGQPLRSRYTDDPAMREPIAEFVGTLPRRVITMRTLVAQRNLPELQRVVHQLKGAGGGFGFDAITRLASQADFVLKQGAPVETIEREINRLAELISTVDGYQASRELTHTVDKILVIDDSPEIHTLVKARLGAEEVVIQCASDGATGLATARDWQPDLILLDVDMPERNGFAVCADLKSDPLTMEIPIVFLTGSTSQDDKIRGLDLGATDYITKPFDPAELKARVRATLRTRHMVGLLAKKAMIDGLTGLWNRTYLDAHMTRAHSFARRTGQPLSCVMADVDCFKVLNDTCGHGFGDDVLRIIAGVLTAYCRSEDVVCRYGGEEFTILLPNADIQAAAGLAERLRLAIEAQVFSHNGRAVAITCSFGVSQLFGPVPPTVLELADEALYRAKRSGRNRVEIDPRFATVAV